MLKVSRLLHAGYIFESAQARIIMDPLFENPFSVNSYAYPSVKFNLEKLAQEKFDAIFISHFHDDHCSFESLKWLDRNTPLYMFCLHDEMFSLLRQLGFKNVFPLTLGQSISIADLFITPHRALDADVDCLFQISCSQYNVLNVVDSWIDPEILQRLSKISWDLVLWPFQTMREIEALCPKHLKYYDLKIPTEWHEVLKKLSPKFLVPSSCQIQFEKNSWLNEFFFPISYAGFEKEIALLLPETEIHVLPPGKTFLSSEELPFIELLEDPFVDYKFNPLIQPPPTREIAMGLIPETNQQKEACLSWVRSLKPHCDFPWKLTLWDHTGVGENFYFNGASDHHFSWTTEIPVVKLYGALFNGESLSSLYLRILDGVDSLSNDTDIMEDPLIRALYDGKFGSYQKAQLKRILLKNEELSD